VPRVGSRRRDRRGERVPARPPSHRLQPTGQLLRLATLRRTRLGTRDSGRRWGSSSLGQRAPSSRRSGTAPISSANRHRATSSPEPSACRS
jgi:hypothetical protein